MAVGRKMCHVDLEPEETHSSLFSGRRHGRRAQGCRDDVCALLYHGFCRLAFLQRIKPAVDESRDHLNIGINRLSATLERIDVPIHDRQREPRHHADFLAFRYTGGGHARQIPALIGSGIEAFEVRTVCLSRSVHERDVGIDFSGLGESLAIVPGSPDDDIVSAAYIQINHLTDRGFFGCDIFRICR